MNAEFDLPGWDEQEADTPPVGMALAAVMEAQAEVRRRYFEYEEWYEREGKFLDLDAKLREFSESHCRTARNLRRGQSHLDP